MAAITGVKHSDMAYHGGPDTVWMSPEITGDRTLSLVARGIYGHLLALSPGPWPGTEELISGALDDPAEVRAATDQLQARGLIDLA